MKLMKALLCVLTLGFSAGSWAADKPVQEIVEFPNGTLTLKGELYLPDGKGPFPVILYSHGSAPGMANSMASAAIGPKFTRQGWAFFMPYRRGQGLSEDQGPYIMDQIRRARWNPFDSTPQKLVELHQGDHLSDQIAALNWLREQPFVDPARIATAGNSFGGIQVMLGMAGGDYCAGINAAGGAQSWQDSKSLQDLLMRAAARAKGPIFHFQAENDYDLTPSSELFATGQAAGKKVQLKIYPRFGGSSQDGHSFPYSGVSVWFDDALNFLEEHCSG